MCACFHFVNVSESEAGIDVSLDVSFDTPVNVSSLKQTLFLTLTNFSFAVDLSSLTVTRKQTRSLLTVINGLRGCVTLTLSSSSNS